MVISFFVAVLPILIGSPFSAQSALKDFRAEPSGPYATVWQ
jgi:hypothetical protein